MFAKEQPVYECLEVYGDQRGFSISLNRALEVYSRADLSLENIYVSQTLAGVSRGMHSRVPEQVQYMTCISGSVHDIVSRTSGDSKFEAEAKILGVNCRYNTVFIPPGWFHGFRAISDSICIYFSNREYEKTAEQSRTFNQLELNILASKSEARLVDSL